MDWLAPLAVLAAIVIFWRLPTYLARYRLLLIGSILLSGFMTWQWLTGFDQRPLDRIFAALVFSIANLLLVALTVWIAQRAQRGQRRFTTVGLLILIGVFILSKWPAAMHTVLQPLGIPVAAWLGISYLLFRLLHVLLESRRNQLPALKLGEMIVYALFPASFIAGPIDRFPRFKTDLDQVGQPFRFNFAADGTVAHPDRRVQEICHRRFSGEAAAGSRSISRQHTRAVSLAGAVWLWLLVVLRFLRLHRHGDRRGTPDRISSAGEFQRALPQNESGALLAAWHITLSSWARDYVFLPLARTLRMRVEWLPANGAALICHLATMLVIGLWHGFAWTFVAWGVWHGVGLFVVKLWGDWRRPRARRTVASGRSGWRTLPGWFVTFNFVMLGWVFFQTSDLSIALTTLGRLFGIK